MANFIFDTAKMKMRETLLEATEISGAGYARQRGEEVHEQIERIAEQVLNDAWAEHFANPPAQPTGVAGRFLWPAPDSADAIHPDPPCRRCAGKGIDFHASPRTVQLLDRGLRFEAEDPANPGAGTGQVAHVRLAAFTYDQLQQQAVYLGPLAPARRVANALFRHYAEPDGLLPVWNRAPDCARCHGTGQDPL